MELLPGSVHGATSRNSVVCFVGPFRIGKAEVRYLYLSLIRLFSACLADVEHFTRVLTPGPGDRSHVRFEHEQLNFSVIHAQSEHVSNLCWEN